MSNVLECTSCGGTNQLPEGKTSMFCAFCGNAIEKNEKRISISENPLKFKPEITSDIVETETIIKNKGDIISTLPSSLGSKRVDGGMEVYDKLIGTRFFRDEYETKKHIIKKGGELRLTNKSLVSIKNIIEWFTDHELENIRVLDVSQNNITKLDGIEKMVNLEILNLSNNNIFDLNKLSSLTNLDYLIASHNKINTIPELEKLESLRILDLSNNPIDLINFKAKLNYKDVLKSTRFINLSNCNFNQCPKGLETLALTNCLLDLRGNQFDFNSHFVSLINKYWKDNKSEAVGICYISNNINFNLDNGKLSKNIYPSEEYHFKYADFDTNYYSKEKLKFNYVGLFIEPIESKSEQIKNPKNDHEPEKGKCFIATAAMGSYNHPQVMELRNFRDEWILSKSWGNEFVKWYYRNGEKVANIIEKNIILKRMSYLLIVKPLVIVSQFLRK